MLKQQQRYENDCALAAIASILNCHYEELWPLEWHKYVGEKGSYGTDVDKNFEIAGLKGKYHQLCNYLGWGKHLDYNAPPLYQRVLNGLLYGRRALIQVPSINFEGKSHMIAWDGHELWDPSPLRTYKTMDEVQWEWVWLIDESVQRYPPDRREWSEHEDPDSI